LPISQLREKKVRKKIRRAIARVPVTREGEFTRLAKRRL